MIQDQEMIKQQEDNELLLSIGIEIDDIFFNLRKADKIIRHELVLLNQKKFDSLRKPLISPINENHLREMINQLPKKHLLMDKFIVYMLMHEKSNIFNLIKDYNFYLEQRLNNQEDDNQDGLIYIDEKLIYYIRHLGAMTYHLNIHLNLLTVLLKNAPIILETQQIPMRKFKESVNIFD